MAEPYEWGDLIQGQVARPKSLLIRRLIADHHHHLVISISSTRRRKRRRTEIKRSSTSSSEGGMMIKAERKGSNKLTNQPLSGIAVRRRVGG